MIFNMSTLSLKAGIILAFSLLVVAAPEYHSDSDRDGKVVSDRNLVARGMFSISCFPWPSIVGQLFHSLQQ